MKRLFFAVFLNLFIVGAALFAQAYSTADWADYVGSEYETIPSITYRTAILIKPKYNELITIKNGKHGGFSRQETVNAYASIRNFLRKNKLNNTD